LMTLRILFCWSISREMFRGRSSLSTTPYCEATGSRADRGQHRLLSEYCQRKVQDSLVHRTPRVKTPDIPVCNNVGCTTRMLPPPLHLDEGQVLWDDLLAVVHDEHAAHLRSTSSTGSVFLVNHCPNSEHQQAWWDGH
jgi:hypothetical protein